jgi:exopolysaccharide biosynthesis polyprenyl glycosylphosphotransferase
VAFILACVARFQLLGPLLGEETPTRFLPYAWILYVSAPLLLYLFKQAGLYDSLRQCSTAHVLWLTLKPFVVAMAILGLAIFLLQDKTFSRPIFFGYLFLGFVLIASEKQILKALAHKARRLGYNTRNVIIVGAGEDAGNIAHLIDDSGEYGYRIKGHLALAGEDSVPGSPYAVVGQGEDLQSFLDREAVDEVIFAAPYSQILQNERLIRLCDEVGVKIHIKLDSIGTLLSRTYPTQLGDYPMLTLTSTPYDAMDVLVKRLIDLSVSAVALVLAAPLLAGTWLAVRLTSRGPAIFKQTRSGLNGRRFVLYKFRSMYVGAEKGLQGLRSSNEMDGPVFKMTGDPRVTRVGHFIRKWSIDELPQFFNVLKGDMSLVGPRPPLPAEVEKYARWQKRRLSVKPGLTCLWQINGRNKIGFEDWMQLDMRYIDNWSLGLDFKIMLQTIPAILFAKGAR